MKYMFCWCALKCHKDLCNWSGYTGRTARTFLLVLEVIGRAIGTANSNAVVGIGECREGLNKVGKGKPWEMDGWIRTEKGWASWR